jgi:hypothetical protein
MSFKVRKFRKKTETEVRDNSSEGDDDAESLLLKEESSAIGGKSKEHRKSSAKKGINCVIYSEHLSLVAGTE